ncbi:MAG: HAD family hydrolase [Microcoleaceae cyanobacterium]
MKSATQPLSNRIAIAFDFDDTLVPDTYDALIEHLGHDSQVFRKERYYPLKDAGWDGIPARFYTLIQASRQRSQKITKDFLADFGRQVTPFPGVSEMFDRLRQSAHTIDAEIEIEFYLITSGFVEIAQNNAIAKHFKAMWGCEFHYNDQGEVDFLKRSLSHPEKTRYLLFLSRGVDKHSEDDLEFVYEDVPEEKLRIPLQQIIYVGDGTSDLPCFALLNQRGGTAIAVYKEGTAQDWTQQYNISRSQKVANLAPADYSKDSELMQSLTLAVESICKRIVLHKMGRNE